MVTGTLNLVPFGKRSYARPTLPGICEVTGCMVILVVAGKAPAGIVSTRLPSADVTAPPFAPMFFVIGVPMGVPTGVMATESVPPGPDDPELPASIFFLQATNSNAPAHNNREILIRNNCFIQGRFEQ